MLSDSKRIVVNCIEDIILLGRYIIGDFGTLLYCVSFICHFIFTYTAAPVIQVGVCSLLFGIMPKIHFNLIINKQRTKAESNIICYGNFSDNLHITYRNYAQLFEIISRFLYKNQFSKIVCQIVYLISSFV